MTQDWTIYNNTTPWGLLTHEQRSELISADLRGIPVEFYNSHGQWESKRLEFAGLFVYRAVYKVTQKEFYILANGTDLEILPEGALTPGTREILAMLIVMVSPDMDGPIVYTRYMSKEMEK